MGYSLSWLASYGKDPQVVLEQLGCSLTGEFGDYADWPLVGRALPNGWYLLVADRCDHEIISDPVLSALSSDCSLVACSIEEHVMASSSSFWTNGRMIWQVAHNSERGLSDLTVAGEPPIELQQIRRSCEVNQAEEVDDEYGADWFFDIPLLLAKRFVGFMHDKVTPGVEEGTFDVLSFSKDMLPEPARPWWRFW